MDLHIHIAVPQRKFLVGVLMTAHGHRHGHATTQGDSTHHHHATAEGPNKALSEQSAKLLSSPVDSSSPHRYPKDVHPSDHLIMTPLGTNHSVSGDRSSLQVIPFNPTALAADSVAAKPQQAGDPTAQRTPGDVAVRHYQMQRQ